MLREPPGEEHKERDVDIDPGRDESPPERRAEPADDDRPGGSTRKVHELPSLRADSRSESAPTNRSASATSASGATAVGRPVKAVVSVGTTAAGGAGGPAVQVGDQHGHVRPCAAHWPGEGVGDGLGIGDGLGVGLGLGEGVGVGDGGGGGGGVDDVGLDCAMQSPPSSTTAVALAVSPVGHVAVAVLLAVVDVPGTVAGFGPDHVTVAPVSDAVYVNVTR